MTEIIFEIGDSVHATFHNNETDTVAAQQFVITGIDGTKFLGGALECDTNAGWVVELLNKSLSNLNLPSVISEIYVVNKRGLSTLVVGKNDTWRDSDGKLIELLDIIRWHPVED